MLELFKSLFENNIQYHDGVYINQNTSNFENQLQTNDVFSDKWSKFFEEEIKKQDRVFEFQKKWYLDLYGFENEDSLSYYLTDKAIILDAGCGLGYKAKWFSELSPKSIVIGMDFSDSIYHAKKKYSDSENLFFVKGDIANTNIKEKSIDYVNCDQVIHHTEDPASTLDEFSRILKNSKEIALYVYAKKALPREILDDHFRELTKKTSKKDMWDFSEQMTILGKKLSDLNIEIDVPDIPLLSIKGGKYDIQRFIYWNFIKCFWNGDLGHENSVSTNYDWYAPSNADRFSKDEFLKFVKNAGLKENYFHSEEACYSGRFKKK